MNDLTRIEAIEPENQNEVNAKKFLLDLIAENKLEGANKEVDDDLLSTLECTIGTKHGGDIVLIEADVDYNNAIEFLAKYNLMP